MLPTIIAPVAANSPTLVSIASRNGVVAAESTFELFGDVVVGFVVLLGCAVGSLSTPFCLRYASVSELGCSYDIAMPDGFGSE